MTLDVLPGYPKLQGLISRLQGLESAVLAFSGGVDSAFLMKALCLSGIRFLAVTASSETMPRRDLESAVSLAREMAAKHLVIRTEELSREPFAANPPDRCFHCKDELFRRLRDIARQGGFASVLDGTNADDLLDYRPGRKAALRHGVLSPLAEGGITKAELREMAKALGLSLWDRPSSPCLASRFPYGERISAAGLRRVEEAEEFLRLLGIREVRVRIHGEVARIEAAEQDLPLLLDAENRRALTKRLKDLGFSYVSLDLEGYRTGSLNRILRQEERN